MKSALHRIVMFAVAISPLACGQSGQWRTQSPCDGGFSVEVPSPLFEVGWFEGKHGMSFEPDLEFDRGHQSYVAFQTHPKVRQFAVVVWDVSGEKWKKERAEFQRAEFGRSDFMIGGDDAQATRTSPVRIGGLVGREYVFDKEIEADTFTRGRIFYADNRLYFVIFRAMSAEDLMSPDANRFLMSFHLSRQWIAPRRKAH